MSFENFKKILEEHKIHSEDNFCSHKFSFDKDGYFDARYWNVIFEKQDNIYFDILNMYCEWNTKPYNMFLPMNKVVKLVLDRNDIMRLNKNIDYCVFVLKIHIDKNTIHNNVIIIDFKKELLLRYEPCGGNMLMDFVDDSILEMFKNLDFLYQVESENNCNDNFCVAHCIRYVFDHLTNSISLKYPIESFMCVLRKRYEPLNGEPLIEKGNGVLLGAGIGALGGGLLTGTAGGFLGGALVGGVLGGVYDNNNQKHG